VCIFVREANKSDWLEPEGGPERNSVRSVARVVFKAVIDVTMLAGSGLDDRGRPRLVASSPDRRAVTVKSECSPDVRHSGVDFLCRMVVVEL
jgi:hypothetical protein